MEVKSVEEVFRRTGRIWHLHVGGQVIRTTAEHPFFVHNKGWVRAGLLQIGDHLLGHDGQWVAVEDVLDTGEWDAVYNLRIADYHTYFVTDWEWGFAVWSHNTNANCQGTIALNGAVHTATISRGGRNFSVTYKGVPTDTGSAYGPNTYRVYRISGDIAHTGRDNPPPAASGATDRYKQYLLDAINGRVAGVTGVAPQNYNPGHLIAATLGGPNDTRNLVPQQNVLNLAAGGYNAMERWIRSVLDGEVAPAAGQAPRAPTQANMVVTVDYPGETSSSTLARFVPTGFHVRVTFESHPHDFNFTQTTSSNSFNSSQRPTYWG